MRNERPIYLEIESQFKEFAEVHGVQIIGSYNSSKVGCSAAEFYDRILPKNICNGPHIQVDSDSVR